MKTYKEFMLEQKQKIIHGYIKNIEDLTINNKNFRHVLYTTKHSQLVLMSLKPKQDIGEEIHKVDQFFRVEKGDGKIIINGKATQISDGTAIIIPSGMKHNIINTGNTELKLYSIYSPPHHKDQIIHKTKQDAINSKEHFDGETTE